jgi:hypothetical protein
MGMNNHSVILWGQLGQSGMAEWFSAGKVEGA